MKKAIVGIDFGTSGLSYAYSFARIPNINTIEQSHLPGQGLNKKVPSEIILDNNLKDVLAFGYECNDYIMEQNDNTQYKHFKNIKMNLYHKKDKIKATNGEEADINLVISKIFQKTSELAIYEIKQRKPSIKKEDIKWVVTIPAIWEEKSKQIMINASKMAGLIDENDDLSLFLALEPEVAGIYYCLINDRDEHINAGEPYIICDIGAGTVDICTHRRNIGNNSRVELIEEYPPIGGDYGGNEINKEFIKRLIIEIFGQETVNNLQINPEKNYVWSKFETEIEKLKCSCVNNVPHLMRLDCHLFNNSTNNKTLENYIDEYYKKQTNKKYKIKKSKFDDWTLEIESVIFYDIIKEISKKIFSKIEEIYNNVHTGYILLTGGGSYNYIISSNLKELANEKNMKIELRIASKPEYAIVSGSVLYGFHRDIIRKRKAKFTLGIGIAKKWDDKYQGQGIKIYNELEQEYKCNNLFSKFITINQYINFDDVITHHYIAMDKNQSIELYKTTKNNCTYKDEKDENGQLIIHKFGEFTFPIGEDFDVNDRRIIIKMKLGGTYIDVCAIYEKTGKRIDIVKCLY